MPRESKKGACSSHTDAAKANCLAHNRREYPLSHVNPHLTQNNRTVFEDDIIKNRKSIKPLKERVKAIYTEKTGQKWQDKTVPFRESVLVVKAGVTDKQLMDFKEQAEKLTGWKCIGIWLHQDEGHAHSKYIEGNEDYAINYHAHVLWDCVNHDSGKAIRADRTKLSRMQDVLADAVGMERGNKASETGRRNRKAMEQRIIAQEERIEQLEQEVKKAMKAAEDAEQAKNQALKQGIKGMGAKFLAMVGGGELTEAKKEIEVLNGKIQSQATQNKTLRDEIKALRGENKALRGEIVTNEQKHLQDLKDAEKAKNEAVEEAKRYERFSMKYDNEKVREECENQLKEKDNILRETEEERILLLGKMKDAGLIGKGDYHEMTTPPHERIWIPEFIMPKKQDHQEQSHVEEPRQYVQFDDEGKQLLQQVVKYAITWLTSGNKFGWLREAFKALCTHLGAETMEQRTEVANIVGNEVGYVGKGSTEKLTSTLSGIDPNERNNGLKL